MQNFNRKKNQKRNFERNYVTFLSKISISFCCKATDNKKIVKFLLWSNEHQIEQIIALSLISIRLYIMSFPFMEVHWRFTYRYSTSIKRAKINVFFLSISILPSEILNKIFQLVFSLILNVYLYVHILVKHSQSRSHFILSNFFFTIVHITATGWRTEMLEF